MMPSRCVASLALALLASPATVPASEAEPPEEAIAAPADTLPLFTVEPVRVRSYRPILIGRDETDPASLPLRPASDGGDFLRTVPGVAGARMGGHGIEPTIRGQQETRLNVLVDGAFAHGGCPNRMDPPSSIADVETADRVVVLRGVRSVLFGAGGSGGTVLFEHLPPRFPGTDRVHGRLSGGMESNTGSLPISGDVAGRHGNLYVRGAGRRHHADDYEDGDGKAVRSAFTQTGGEFRLGWRRYPASPVPGDHVEGAITWDRTTDALFAGAGMDAPESEVVGFRLRGERAMTGRVVRRIRAHAYLTNVDHTMDNYTLRPATQALRVARTTSDTMGGRLLVDLAGGITAGADVQRLAQDGTRYGNLGDPTSVTAVQATLWPDVVSTRIGLVAEGTRDLSARTRVVAGARYDRVSFTWGSADRVPTLATMGLTRSPNDLYAFFYGATAADVTENNLGGLARLEFAVRDGVLLHAGVSRTVRTADPTERALGSEMGAMSWVGNPGLRPEKHHQIDLGASLNRSVMSAAVSTWVDRVDDFIFRDSARSQDGILVTLPNADVYHNIEATLAGCEVEAAVRPFATWEFTLDGVYTWGENGETHGPLPQIPPLQGSLGARVEGAGWDAGGRIHAAVRQTRVDADPLTGSGLDVGKTPGYGVVDLFGGVDLGGGARLRVGVANVFDAVWSDHLNRENGVDNTVLQVHEPGRSVYGRAVVEF